MNILRSTSNAQLSRADGSLSSTQIKINSAVAVWARAANGNGKLCTEMKTPRAKMSSYMKEKSLNNGYINLRTQTGFGLPK